MVYTASAVATGGSGGGASGAGFSGGNGGNATATATANTTYTYMGLRSVMPAAEATAGAGGPGNNGATPGIGGTALATANVMNVTISQTVYSNANGPGSAGAVAIFAYSYPVMVSLDSVGNVNPGAVTVTGSLAQLAGITGNGSLTIGDGVTPTTLQLAQNSGVSSQNSLSILANATLDITNNCFVIDYGSGPDPIASIASWIKNGYYGLPGPSIVSSEAAADDLSSGYSYGIGYADSADPGNPANLPSGEIEIMYTLIGDVNLDGTVNAEDFTLFSHNLGQSGSWDSGDFNYDGTVNAVDFTPFSHNLGQSAALAAQAGVLDEANGISLANVPEPASMGFAATVGFGLLARRRRSLPGKNLVSNLELLLIFPVQPLQPGFRLDPE